MNKNIILIALLCLLSIDRVGAQSVTVEAKIDSLQILIGEQAKIQLQVAMDAKQRAVFPAYTDTLVRGVEIIETAKPDTQFLNDRQRMMITQEYTVTSFDSALYYLPPMPVTVDGKEYRSRALALKVYSIPVDTLHPDQFFGQKTVMKAPFAWEDWYGLIGCSFLALPLLGLLIYLIVRIRDNKPIIRKIKVEPKLPPHQAAMKEIERIKNEKVWQKGQPKEYYTELTDTLRTYIKDRFGFNALEMTSSEIIDKLLEMKDKEAISDLKELFQTADLVKFAKHDPQMNENDANLITNQLIYKLAPEAEGDYSWVRPGKIAWDWYNALILTGVDFKCGINNDTYKYYIDFASKYGIEYVVIDDGWSEAWDVTKTIPEINMEELVAYGKKKNVDLILWVSWAPFREKIDEAFDKFSQWGIKGIKMDFMNRDDQEMVDFYYEVARKAAARKMLVDFHGAYKPTGWLRTFPNVLTSEGVAGLENHKWGSFVTPKHNVTLPFTRMVAGPMDYTPGAMINFHEKDHKIWFNLPASVGTRCHQLGMYVVYESPLQMLADSPSNYYREPVCMEFLSQVPVVWDETRVLKASVGEYVVVARRHGDTWYIGGMVGEKGQKFEIDLDFIKGNKTLTYWEDGVNVDMNANDFARRVQKVKQGDKITITMYDGGGYAAIIK